MVFKIRKLCSSTEEYEANSDSPVNLYQMGERLSNHPGVELSRCGAILTILFEDEGVVVRLFASGKALIQANMRRDAEKVCIILTEASGVQLTESKLERS
ncbi:MAG: hypothetical protein ISF22_03135 [Methanomassiliicoccus sp.]|nr:hypothetical protein [Methanomassiliicoccus sp.]